MFFSVLEIPIFVRILHYEQLYSHILLFGFRPAFAKSKAVSEEYLQVFKQNCHLLLPACDYLISHSKNKVESGIVISDRVRLDLFSAGFYLFPFFRKTNGLVE